MTTHGTVRKMTDGQRGDIVATMAVGIPPDFSFDEAQAIIGAKTSFIAEIRDVFAKRRHISENAVPADDEWFELEVDDDVDPMGMVVSAGYDPKNWKYLGPQLSGKKTFRVKLVRLGHIHNLDEAKKKADEMGCRLIEGQARDPFKAKFSKVGGSGPVIFGGSEWQGPLGDASVAYLSGLKGEWLSFFGWSGLDFLGHCRWLVVGK